jgi:hypothetical protein
VKLTRTISDLKNQSNVYDNLEEQLGVINLKDLKRPQSIICYFNSNISKELHEFLQIR